jgi:hypothetical protein
MHKLTLSYHNEEASKPLIIPLEIICNTDEREVLANVLINSQNNDHWLRMSPAHDRVAVVCGSGPSLADTLDEIGHICGELFALNNAAKYLADHGLLPDYQVIMDAQPQTIDLIGPARQHLFASMVDPSLFDAKPDAILWHATHGDVLVDEQPDFPKHDTDYVMIGGGASVGNTTLPLVYAMGYRKIHIFGMDSSHREGAGHVIPQAINGGDPCMIVSFNHQEYVCSFTMKTQADHFIQRARHLEGMGCEIKLHGSGYLPDLWNHRQEFDTEQEKYEALYKFDSYHATSPGARVAKLFVEIVKPQAGCLLVDYGCGNGIGTLELRKLTDCEIIQVDFASNCRNPEAQGFEFIQCDMTRKIPITSDYGFCADVLEHVYESDVDSVITNIMNSTLECFFQISTVGDSMGDVIGHNLHVTIKPHEWWRERFLALGYAVRWEQKEAIAALFHIGLTT